MINDYTLVQVLAKSKFIPVIPKFHIFNFKTLIAIQRHEKKIVLA